VTAGHTSVAAACRVDRVALCSVLPLGGVTPRETTDEDEARR
jgi:hypothetical protein